MVITAMINEASKAIHTTPKTKAVCANISFIW